MLNDSVTFKNAEPLVQKCADYLLTTPCIENPERVQTTQFLMRWMEATPDYSFGFNEHFIKAIKSNLSLVGLYMAGQVKVASDGEYTQDYDEFQFEAISLFLSCCENPTNQVKITGENSIIHRYE